MLIFSLYYSIQRSSKPHTAIGLVSQAKHQMWFEQPTELLSSWTWAFLKYNVHSQNVLFLDIGIFYSYKHYF